MITIKVETKYGIREFKVNSRTLPVADRISELLGNCEYIECQGCKIWSPVDYGQKSYGKRADSVRFPNGGSMRITIESEDGRVKKQIRVRSASLESKVGVDRVKQTIEAYSFIEGDFTRCELCEVIWDDAEVNECEDGYFRCPDCRANAAGVCEQVDTDGAGP